MASSERESVKGHKTMKTCKKPSLWEAMKALCKSKHKTIKMEDKTVKHMRWKAKACTDQALDYLQDMEKFAKQAKEAMEEHDMNRAKKRLEDVVDYCELVKLELAATRAAVVV